MNGKINEPTHLEYTVTTVYSSQIMTWLFGILLIKVTETLNKFSINAIVLWADDKDNVV